MNPINSKTGLGVGIKSTKFNNLKRSSIPTLQVDLAAFSSTFNSQISQVRSDTKNKIKTVGSIVHNKLSVKRYERKQE